MDTGRGASHTGVCCGGIGEREQGIGSWGGIVLGEEIPNVDDRAIAHVYLRNKPA